MIPLSVYRTQMNISFSLEIHAQVFFSLSSLLLWDKGRNGNGKWEEKMMREKGDAEHDVQLISRSCSG